MNSILLTILAVALIATVLGLFLRSRSNGLLPMANYGEQGTHDGSVTRKTDAAITTRHLLFAVGSDGAHIAACGASGIPVGTVDDEAAAAEENVAVLILGKGPTKLMVASEAITAGEAVFTAASGKVQDLPAGAGTYYQVGYALTAAGADGDVFEVQDHAPIKTVVS